METPSALSVIEQQLEKDALCDFYTYCFLPDNNLNPDSVKSIGKYYQAVLKSRLEGHPAAEAPLEALKKAAGSNDVGTCLYWLDTLYQIACGLKFQDKNLMPAETKGLTPLDLALKLIDIDAHQGEKHNKGGYGPGVFNLATDKVEFLLRQIVIQVLEAYDRMNKLPPFLPLLNSVSKGMVCAVLVTNIKMSSFAQRLDGKNVDKSNANEKSCYVIVQIDLLSDRLSVHGYPCSDEGYVKVIKAGSAKTHKEMMGVLQISIKEITDYCKS